MRGVPRETTSFVGRSADLAELGGLVARERLVSVLGPPGVGKTRLVCELLARERAPVDEVVFVDLAEASTAEAMRVAVARALEVPLSTASENGDGEICRALAARGRCLLVVDDFEKLIADASLVDRWLAAAPELRVLVTSRERLRLAGEVAFDLAPLALATGAVELFIARAQTVRRDFAPVGDELAEVASLVEALDGLPLAIELCAARVRVLSPRQLAARLADDSDAASERLLAGPPAGRRGLREAVQASIALLDESERSLLAACSVFRGGFTAEAIEEVLGDAAEGPWPLDVLHALVDKSLLVAVDAANGGRRFRLLSTLRAFAVRGLVPETVQAALVRRHSRYFGRFGLRLAQRMLRGDEVARIELACELDNMFAAHAAAVASGDSTTALKCAIAASPVLTIEGPLGRCVSMLDEALVSHGASEAPRALLAAAHAARALAALLTGDAVTATTSAARAIEIARALGEPLLLARVLRQAAKVDSMHSRWEPARSALAESLELARRAGDHHGEGWSLAGLGDLAFYIDDLREASQRYEEARLLFQAVGDRSASAVLRFSIGSVAVERDQLVLARQELEGALGDLAVVGERRTACFARSFLAILDQSEGHFERARAGFLEAIAMARRIDFRRCEGTALGYLAGCLLEEGETEQAIVRYGEAFFVLEGSGSTISVFFRAALAAALSMRGDDGAARAELDAARAILDRTSQQSFAAAVIAIHEGQLALAQMRRAGSEGERTALMEAARSALAVDPALASQSDVRFACRLLKKAMAGACGGASHSSSDFVIAESGRWFRCPGQDAVDLSRRRSLRLLLQALAHHWQQGGGRALDIAEIAAIGWPGEAIMPDAATERVYTAVATLRRLGLQNALVRRDDGYLLDPLVSFRVEPEAG